MADRAQGCRQSLEDGEARLADLEALIDEARRTGRHPDRLDQLERARRITAQALALLKRQLAVRAMMGPVVPDPARVPDRIEPRRPGAGRSGAIIAA